MFPCTKCGLCCQNLSRNILYKDLDRGDGVCSHLTKTMTCGIYDNRPILCRIDEAYDALFSKQVSLLEYYKLNAQSCYELQAFAGVPRAERISTLNLS